MASDVAQKTYTVVPSGRSLPRITDHALRIDHIGSGHRQCPRVVAVILDEFHSEFAVHLPQRVGSVNAIPNCPATVLPASLSRSKSSSCNSVCSWLNFSS